MGRQGCVHGVLPVHQGVELDGDLRHLGRQRRYSGRSLGWYANQDWRMRSFFFPFASSETVSSVCAPYLTVGFLGDELGEGQLLHGGVGQNRGVGRLPAALHHG